MVQYLLNATAIWLLSLFVFDVFLRKETMHGYNRLYLLGSFFSGLVIPLLGKERMPIAKVAGLELPAAQVATARQNIVEATNNSFLISWQDTLLIIYALGATVSFLYLLKELRVIVRLYRKGEKLKDGVWTIIETGQQHSPFSAFRYVFLSSRENYSKEELDIVLRHEEQHGHLLHFIDLLLMQLTKVVFWFHPLVYIYHSRLMIVHEYQADAGVEQSPAEYGQFLVEQSILQSAPIISHSFNRSPIKKRLVMLSRKNVKPSRGKQWLFIPLLLITVSCFKKVGIISKPVKEGNKITYKGNVFETKTFLPDTMMVEDPMTGELTMAIRSLEGPPYIFKMNGERIFSSHEDGQAGELQETYIKIEAQLKGGITTMVNQLPKGKYRYAVYNIVVDTKGNILFYENAGITPEFETKVEIPKDMETKINDKMTEVMEDMKGPVFVNKGKPVTYCLSISSIIEVK